jgi:hypothetical protein
MPTVLGFRFLPIPFVRAPFMRAGKDERAAQQRCYVFLF